MPEDPKVLETLSTFQAKIDEALMAHEEWVETSPEVIKYYNRKGMNGAKFFIFKGIKVCEFGQAEAIEAENNVQMDVKLHGENEAKFVGR